jgi:hypothetical protein
MHVVIEIPDRAYKAIKNSTKPLLYLEHLIQEGTPLPKGHGRLIDADAVLEEPIGNTYKDIDIAETIIEAESEDKYEK